MQWDASDVRWRGETDNEDSERVTPLTGVARDALERARDRSGRIGDVFEFPEQRKMRDTACDGPRSRHTFTKWWREAEALAGLAHDDRWGWHSLRRKLASELRNAPLRDVCDLDGWKSAATVLTCHQTPDPMPLTLGLRDWNRYILERKSGRLAPVGPKGRTRRGGVSSRQIGFDLTMLRAVLRWATMAGDGVGGALLERNPCAGFPIPSETSPRRPRMPEERYQTMLAIAGEVHPEFGLALVLANETGHRLNSIRQLMWSDIQWDASDIRWRGETDKEDSAHTTPLTVVAREALATARDRSGMIGTRFVFPEQRRMQQNAEARPRSRHTFTKWWREAEALAGLAHDDRWGWHSLRRKFPASSETPRSGMCAISAHGSQRPRC